MTFTSKPQAAADQARNTYRRKSKRVSAASNPAALRVIEAQRVSAASNPAALRVIEAESETGPDDYSYRVIGLGMAALSGMIMGFLIGWLSCAWL
jgi:hypothetical protein